MLGSLFGIGRKKRAAERDIWNDFRSLAWFGMCDCERKAPTCDAAIADCQKALTYDSKDPFAHYTLGLAFMTKAINTGSVAELDPALQHFQQMLENQSRHGGSRHRQEEHRQHPAVPQAAPPIVSHPALAAPALSFLLMRSVTLPVLAILFVLQARPANQFALTVDNIMRGPALVGYEPTGVRWSHDSNRIYFQWKQHTEKEIAPMDTYVGQSRRQRPAQALRRGDQAAAARLRRHDQGQAPDGLLQRAATSSSSTTPPARRTQLTKTTDTEANPRFTQDGKRISFTRNGNLYVMSLDSGMLVQLTDIRAPAAPATSCGARRRRRARLRRRTRTGRRPRRRRPASADAAPNRAAPTARSI